MSIVATVRVWTVAEANAALPRVAETVERIRGLLAEAAKGAAGNGRRTVSGNGHGSVGSSAAGGLAEALQELGDDGIALRDPERGLVDFTAVAPSGRQYWLCWVVGEPEVGWWHWPEDGFAGRQPLSTPPE